MEYLFFNCRDAVNLTIPFLLHIAQRSPRFRELYIDIADPFDCVPETNDDVYHNVAVHFGSLLSTNVELGIILASQLEVLSVNGNYVNFSLLDLARIVDALFSHSTSLPVLKSLTFDVDAHPCTWLTVQHLIRGTTLMFNCFPKLIHFSLNCQPYDAFKETIYDFSNLASEWYVKWTMSKSSRMFRTLTYRHRPNSLDIWL
jgi:hypothetical protein